MVLHLKEFGEGHARTVELDPQDGGRQAEDEDGQARDEHRALSLVAVVHEVSDTEFDGGDHRRQGGEGEGEEEHRRHDERPNGATRGLSKDLGKGEEGDGGGTTGHRGQGVGVDREDGREHRQTGDDGNAVVGEPHRECVEHRVLVFAHVDGVGDAHAHTGRTRPRRLRQTVDPHFRLKQHVEVHGEHEQCTVKGAVTEVHPQREEERQEEQREQGNHEVEIDLFNRLCTLPDGAQHQQNHQELEKDDLTGRLQEGVPYLGGVHLVAAQRTGDAELEVLQRPAGHHGVVEPDGG